MPRCDICGSSFGPGEECPTRAACDTLRSPARRRRKADAGSRQRIRAAQVAERDFGLSRQMLAEGLERVLPRYAEEREVAARRARTGWSTRRA